MKIQNLPTELKLQIVHQLDPDSTLQFALTCRQHGGVCRSSLEHHTKLFSEWQVLNLDEDERKKREGKTIWCMLDEILRDPQKGKYVREITLPLNRQHRYGGSTLESQQSSLSLLSRKEQDTLKEATRELHQLYTNKADENNELISALEEHLNYDDAITALLIHQLPVLKTLRISGMTASRIVPLIDQISLRQNEFIKAPELPLQTLSTAVITPVIGEGNRNMDWISAFFHLPSLQIFAAHFMTAASIPKPRLMPHSNITVLFFYHCRFDPEVLDQILAGIKALRKFAYIIGSYSFPYIRYEPKKLLATIANQTKDSLEELILNLQDFREEDGAEDSLQVVSLRCFKQLKVLDCRWRMLRPENDGKVVDETLELGGHTTCNNSMLDFTVTSILPPSLESLFLDGVFDSVDWNTLAALPEITQPVLKKLTKFCFRKYDGYWSNVPDQILNNTGLPPDQYLKPLKALFDGYGHY